MANTWTTTRSLHSGLKRSAAGLVTTITSFLIFSMSFLPFGIVLVLYFAFSILCGPCFFCMRAPSHILQFVAFLFTFVVAYVFFSATSSSIRKFSSLFLCLFVSVIEVKTVVFFYFISPGPFVFSSFIHLAFLSTHGTCFYHRFFWFEFRIHNHGISVLFCLQISVRGVHTGGLLNGRRPLSSCYLELVIRGSMVQLPGLFSTFQIYSAFAICCQFYGLVVIYAGSSRLHVYLVSRKSVHRFVVVGFFLCVVLLASSNVSLFHDFRSCAPAISPVDLGRVLQF